MGESACLAKARALLESAQGKSLSAEQRCQYAIDLTALILEEAQRIQTPEEKSIQAQLARMMADPRGKAFTTSMADQCFRSERPARVASQLTAILNKFGIPHYLPFGKRFSLWLFKTFGQLLPNLFVPLAKGMVRKETMQVILPGEPGELESHLRRRAAEGVRINLNHLGEAILGEDEAERRLNTYIEDLAKPEVEYISIKISTICSQLNLLAWDDTLVILAERLRRLFRAAKAQVYTRPNGTRVPKFVNLDMEEYRDLVLTLELFKRVLDEPEFHHFSAGIVLQSYLPDSYPIQQDLTKWAMQRVARGRAPIKIRLVKGANLAMEQVDAALHGWPQAPYLDKIDVDANFKVMLVYGCAHAAAAHLGVGSHNLFDISYALLLRAENAVEPYVCFEMLEGMSDHQRRVVQQLTGDMLLYCPAATEAEFQNAIAYLIRRLDENTAPENFLHDSFGLHLGSSAWKRQVELFTQSCHAMESVSHLSRREQNRFDPPTRISDSASFENEADTDWSLSQNRLWAEPIFGYGQNHLEETIPLVIGGKRIITQEKLETAEDPSCPNVSFYYYSLATPEHLQLALETAEKAQAKWGQTPVAKRAALLGEIAYILRGHRDELIGTMIADTGKTIPEADLEVSEAIDFAEYYRRNLQEISTLSDIKWHPKGIVVVAPPWNFPCSIPAGGILAALAAGNSVIFKPAPEAVLVGWQLVQLFWQAGVNPQVLQFITCEDDPVGSQLIQDPRVASVVLTGGTATAKHFLKLRPNLDLMAETGGKNALIVTSLADRDLAIKDVIQSAFGHAGQKCSACSLLICEAEVYDDPNFRRQLRDAAASLRVGDAWELSTRLNPLIRSPNPTLHRGLTQLEKGEEWLLEPKRDLHNPNLWSPGIKLGVKPQHFTYQNELFGPVLGVMRANNLSEAIAFANGTPYGLTAGLHSLDEREQVQWSQQIEAGNCYINRGITGAIVQRQPFGGTKDSSFGPGAKVGGPNYLMQLMRPEQIALPQEKVTPPPVVEAITRDLKKRRVSEDQLALWEASVGSYAFYWDFYFSQDHDPSEVLGEDNLLRYVSRRGLTVRIHARDPELDLLRVMAAAAICSVPIEISVDESQIRGFAKASWLKQLPVTLVKETETEFTQRLGSHPLRHIRFLSVPSAAVLRTLANRGSHYIVASVLANGRIELLRYLREVSFSIVYHRYGNLGEREGKQQAGCSTCRTQGCQTPGCQNEDQP